MITITLIGALLLAVTVAIHAVGTTWWVQRVIRRHQDERGLWDPGRSLWILLTTAWITLVLHAAQIG